MSPPGLAVHLLLLRLEGVAATGRKLLGLLLILDLFVFVFVVPSVPQQAQDEENGNSKHHQLTTVVHVSEAVDSGG